MNRRRPLQTLLSLTAVLVLAVSFAACGGADGGSDSSAPIATVEDTIDAWFAASRAGVPADKCKIETDRYKTEQYGGPGRPCLQDDANNMKQSVWAANIKIVGIEEAGDTATATVKPNAATDATATVGLTKVDGVWMVDSFA